MPEAYGMLQEVLRAQHARKTTCGSGGPLPAVAQVLTARLLPTACAPQGRRAPGQPAVSWTYWTRGRATQRSRRQQHPGSLQQTLQHSTLQHQALQTHFSRPCTPKPAYLDRLPPAADCQARLPATTARKQLLRVKARRVARCRCAGRIGGLATDADNAAAVRSRADGRDHS